MKLTTSTLKRSGLIALLTLVGSLFWISAPVAAAAPTSVFIGESGGSHTCTVASPATCSGVGWNYDTVTKTLHLENFNGYEIYADGDLKISLKGNNIITGRSGFTTDLVTIAPRDAAGRGGITITTAGDENGSLTLNKANRNLSVISAPDEVKIAGKANVTINHTYPGGGNCANGTTALISSIYDKITVYGKASVIANAQSCYTGGGLPEAIFRAATFITFDTSGNVTANMTSADGVVDKSRMVVLSSRDTSFSTKHLIFRGSGAYKFNAPQQVLASSGYGVIGGTVQASSGQVIRVPAGANFDGSGILVDAANNDIRPTTNELIVSKAPIVTTHNLTINCGVGGTCTPNHANPYNDGETATITLAPAAGKRVKTVTGATKVNDTTYTVLMDSDKTVAVEFEDIPAITYSLTINCGVGGTCTPNHANPYNDGETATITLTLNAGKKVKTVTGATKVDNTTYTVLMDGDKTVAVEFEDIPVPPTAISVDKTILKQNEYLTVGINNLEVGHEGKTAVFWLNSDPIKLGEATVLHGNATVTALVPCSVKPGNHTVTTKINGVLVGTPVTVTVVSSPVCVLNAPNTPKTPKTGIGANRSLIVFLASMIIAIGLTGLICLKTGKKAN